jgi:hypothetical protein
MPSRSASLDEILRLDPVADHERITHLVCCYEFPFDTTRSLELAFFRTFAVPRIARLLESTNEFVCRSQRRYDDTDLILSTIVEDGYESPTGRRALRRMNQLHRRFLIENEDFLYVLSTIVFEPIRWTDRFGWRAMVENERLGIFHCWREIGRRMNIAGIPEGYGEFERFNVEYERTNFGCTEAGTRVAVAMREMFLSWFPGLPRTVGRRALHAVLDDPLREALGFPRPTAAERRAVEAGMRMRSHVVRLLPPRRRPRLRTAMKHRSYPGGWELEALGPPPAGRIGVG